MRLGLLGDVHGNHLALRAVLAAAAASGVERLLVTGDLVGYYFAPKDVLDLLRPWARHVVRGNHEDMLRAARNDMEALAAADARYGPGLRMALEQLDNTQVDELCGLPHPLELELGARRILLCHGCPWDNGTYVYPDAAPAVLERCAAGGHDLVVLGHTHYAAVHRVGATTIVNPGSVGQPRDRKPGAAWALYDTATGEASLRRESYTADEIIMQSRLRAPALPYLVDTLVRT